MKKIFQYIALSLALFITVHINAEEIKPVSSLPFVATTVFRPGWEERGPEFAKWLSTSVRIGGGSGTMVYYDDNGRYVYVLSCGHLFNDGRRSAADYKRRPQTIRIEVFYHNQTKLPKVKVYDAQVLCHVWGDKGSSVFDVSLMRFKADWSDPICTPIAPLSFVYKENAWLHSVGCDGRSETAHYLVQCRGEQYDGNVTEMVSVGNSPRGGRSGGGLMSNGGELIGICSRGGMDHGYWSSLRQIHRFLKEEGFGFVLESQLARTLLVVDRNNVQGKYFRTYIPIPGISF